MRKYCYVIYSAGSPLTSCLLRGALVGNTVYYNSESFIIYSQ